MCGISGFFDASADFTAKRHLYEQILQDMKQALTPRGPDDSGVFLTQDCGLAHTRLSIIDPAGGHQPMARTIKDACCHIVYNGEIYNTDVLKRRLLSQGCVPKTTSDTEVILLSYLTFGADFIRDVDGIFSLAIYDPSLSFVIRSVSSHYFIRSKTEPFCFPPNPKACSAFPA